MATTQGRRPTKFSVFRKIDDAPSVAIHGQVNTLPHIVDFMLDLAGYSTDKPLERLRLLEPGSGNGAFLVAAARRLIESVGGKLCFKTHHRCLLGVEKESRLVEATRESLRRLLMDSGCDGKTSRLLASSWVTSSDFLEMPTDQTFDFVVGNPPYVRQEALCKVALDAYRQRFSCFYDRADLYVAFFEHGLRLLNDAGTLSFICPNRFTKNNYGRKLRQLISHDFQLTHVVDLPHASPFEQEVISYPGIYVIKRGKTDAVNHVFMQAASEEECFQAQKLMSNSEAGKSKAVVYHRYDSWFSGESKWATRSPEHLALLRKLESDCIPLGNPSSGCTVGIGIATGADDVFIVEKGAVDIEERLLLPLVTTKDIKTGTVQWGGKYLVNPFDRKNDNGLIDLKKFPKAQRYFESHKARLTGRHVGKRNPEGWYRTIDKVHPHLTAKPMVLIPDIKGDNLTVALKEEALYPHHNLYFVTSDVWEPAVLLAILRSDIARFFVFMYGVKMRQGFYRFQAQYLRRIVVPPRLGMPSSLIRQIERTARNGDGNADELLHELYGLNRKDRQLLRSFDEAS